MNDWLLSALAELMPRRTSGAHHAYFQGREEPEMAEERRYIRIAVRELTLEACKSAASQGEWPWVSDSITAIYFNLL